VGLTALKVKYQEAARGPKGDDGRRTRCTQLGPTLELLVGRRKKEVDVGQRFSASIMNVDIVL
jgi:hypothetical protein